MLLPSTPLHQIVFSHLRACRGQLTLGTLCLIGVSVTSLLEPWPFKIVIDYVLLHKHLPPRLAFLSGLLQGDAGVALAVMGGALIAIVVATGSCAYGQQFITFRIGYQLIHKLRSELFDHLQRLPLSFHNKARAGELMNKMTADTTNLRDVYSEYLLQLASNVLTVAGMMAVMLVIDWRLALVLLVTFPLLAATLFYFLHQVKAAVREQRSREGNLASRMGEMLGAVSLVKALGREGYERARFEEESTQFTEDGLRAIRMERAGARLINVITAIGSAAVLIVGGARALDGHITPGDLLVFLSYVQHMYKPVRAMARLSAHMAKAASSVERINEVLEATPDVQDAADAIEAADLRGDIRFEAVSFAYESGKPVLDKISFHIPAGTQAALVGASGTGKSTIANLMVRLYDATEGRILIDGVDVRRYRRESLRREIGMVFQNAMLLGATVRENIAYGKPEATDQEIENAARRAQAHDFIAALPHGYDELIGAGGATLSGGQRQRICLARTLLRQPAILLLDEPTSAVDAESEVMIRDAVRTFHAEKTMLMVAHQIYTVRDADLIMVLKDGRIVEQGTHDELLALGGHYCELFKVPLAGITPEGGASPCGSTL